MTTKGQKPSESKKKSIFQKFSFRNKKQSNDTAFQKERQGEDSSQILPNSQSSEKAPPRFNDKDVVLTPEHDTISDGHKHTAVDQGLLRTLDVPSCFMPNVNVSGFPDTQIYSLALKANKENLKALIAANGEDHPDVNERKIQTAEVYKGLGEHQEAVVLLNEVINSYQRRSDVDSMLLSSAMNDLALVYSTLQQHENAEDAFHKTVTILSQTVEADQAVVWGNNAITLRNSNKFSEAIQMHDLAVKMMDTILGKDSPEALFQRGQLAVTLRQSGNRDDQRRGESLLTTSIAQLETLGYGQSHVWIKDLLQ